MSKFLKQILVILYFIVVLFFISPIISLVITNISYIHIYIRNPIIISAMLVSIKSILISTIIIILIGLPVSYFKARYSFKYKNIIDSIYELPLVLPPSVAGLLLLITFGRNGFIGQMLYERGIAIPFSFIAIIIAQIFVGLPVFIKTVCTGIENTDKDYEITAMILGDNPIIVFFRVILPLSKNTILTALIMSIARMLAEFGATIMFAGNLPGKTQTLPLAIYTAMEKDMNLAMTISLLLVIISIFIIAALKVVSNKSSEAKNA